MLNIFWASRKIYQEIQEKDEVLMKIVLKQLKYISNEEVCMNIDDFKNRCDFSLHSWVVDNDFCYIWYYAADIFFPVVMFF